MQLSKAYSNQLCQFMYKFPFLYDFTPYIVYIHNNSICIIITTIHSIVYILHI